MSTNTFDLIVPRKPAADEYPIKQVKLVVSLESEATAGSPVTFEVSDPRGLPPSDGPIPPLWTGSEAASVNFEPIPADAVDFDALVIHPPEDSADCPADDPCRRRYLFVFDLLSDYDPNPDPDTGGKACHNTMAADETWTITVDSGPEIASACVTSFNSSIPGSECVGPVRPLDPGDEDVAEIEDFPAEHPCGEYRPPLDVILVLDKSGSMAGSTTGVGGTKIVALRNAMTDFVEIWEKLRETEQALDPPVSNADEIGVVLFEGDADWWTLPSPPHPAPGLSPGLNLFGPVKDIIASNVDDILPGGVTSIGDGLFLADEELDTADPARRRVILLMSDGLQNTDRHIGVEADQVVTYPRSDPADTTPLANQDNYQVYTVTVGSSAGVDADIKEGIADATGGFYVNTEDEPDQLSPFFMELLQNFIRFNSWETARLIHETVTPGAPFTASIPFSTTTKHVAMVLRWPPQMGVLRLRVTPSGESQPIEATGDSTIMLSFDVPTSSAYTYLDEWKIEIELAELLAHVSSIPFDFVALADDVGLNVDMNIVSQRHAPGDQVQFEVRVREVGRPVTGLGSDPKDRMVVQVVKPGVGIGDLLSDSAAPTTQPFEGDTLTPANAKLYNELQENPGALVRDDTGRISLADGADGIYRGTYTVREPGHYNFLFVLEGRAENTGRFSRMQLKTIHVRPLPDAEATTIQTDISSSADGNRIVVGFTPTTKFGNRLGPGWANYFWFTSTAHKPFKARDNMDGTYTAALHYTGFLPPTISMHFLDLPMVIDKSVSPDKLPVPLDDKTALIKELPGTGCLGLILALIRRLLP